MNLPTHPPPIHLPSLCAQSRPGPPPPALAACACGGVPAAHYQTFQTRSTRLPGLLRLALWTLLIMLIMTRLPTD
jgi:hypothetical protein